MGESPLFYKVRINILCFSQRQTLDVLKLASECDIPSRSMIRPRKGNFIYSSEELKQMQGDIDMVRSFNIEGVVFGATLPNGNLDQDLLEELISNFLAP